MTMATTARLQNNALASSSPAFGTPVHPFKPGRPPAQPVFKPAIPSILPIILPPASLRPLAFRAFTKKRNLTLGSSALQSLASFVGRHCGSGWREDGTAEQFLDEVARLWKAGSGPVIVEDGDLLKNLLKSLEGCMSSGRIVSSKPGLSRQSTFSLDGGNADVGEAPPPLQHQTSFGMSNLEVESVENEEAISRDPRSWIEVVSASSHPRFTFNAQKSHYIPSTGKPSLLAPPSARTQMFRDRYAVIHSLILRNPAFQAPTLPSGGARTLQRADSSLTTAQQTFRLTPIANLLGRSGTNHLLLGQLAVSPAGSLVLQDLTGSIILDLAHARPLSCRNPEEAPWLYPGAVVLVEGVYREDFAGAGSTGLGGGSGVGGTIGGKFLGFSVGVPPVERRHVSLGVVDEAVKKERPDEAIGGGFGWTAFLPSGSEKAAGARMRRLEKSILANDAVEPERRRIVVLSEVNLDLPECLEALRKVLSIYARDKEEDRSPLAFVLIGNFVSSATMAEGKAGGSIEYKECFNALAAVLSDFPALLRNSRWTFVPGDNDAWSSAFSAGSSVALPRGPVPDLFTSRVKRVFREARSEAGVKKDDSLDEVWSSNPARVTLFGTAHEIAVLRDDISSRMRRTAINYGKGALEEDRQEQSRGGNNAEELDSDIVMSGGLGEAESTAIETAASSATEQVSPAPAAAAASPNSGSDKVDSTTQLARRIVLSLLPQASLSPFPLATRPVHWAFGTGAGPMSLYPLPHTLVLADASAPPFAVTYEGCHVVNPGRLVRGEGRRKRCGWVEYDAVLKRAEVRELWM